MGEINGGKLYKSAFWLNAAVTWLNNINSEIK